MTSLERGVFEIMTWYDGMTRGGGGSKFPKKLVTSLMNAPKDKKLPTAFLKEFDDKDF